MHISSAVHPRHALCCISITLETPYVAWGFASGQAGHTHSKPDEEPCTGRESSIPEVRLCSWSVCSSGPSCLSWAAPLPSLKALGPEQNPLWPANLVQQGLREQRPGAPAPPLPCACMSSLLHNAGLRMAPPEADTPIMWVEKLKRTTVDQQQFQIWSMPFT